VGLCVPVWHKKSTWEDDQLDGGKVQLPGYRFHECCPQVKYYLNPFWLLLQNTRNCIMAQKSVSHSSGSWEVVDIKMLAYLASGEGLISGS
jgi:hypothetical protein